MKIILTAAVSQLGKIGDVVEVKNGYAKNFLIPTKKAICFTTNNYKSFEAKKQEFEKQDNDSLEFAKKIKEALSGKNIVIVENASDDGRLYGSVSSSVIAAKINEAINSKSVTRGNVFLKKPIKDIGIYQVGINMHSDVEIFAKLIVSRSDSEVEALLKSEKKNEKKSSSEEVEE